MKRIKCTKDRIIGILMAQQAGVSVADLCRKHSASDATGYKWKANAPFRTRMSIGSLGQLKQ